jgi:hypothetical protein
VKRAKKREKTPCLRLVLVAQNPEGSQDVLIDKLRKEIGISSLSELAMDLWTMMRERSR